MYVLPLRMYDDDNQVDLRNNLRLSDLLRTMAEQSIQKQLRDGPMYGEHLTNRLLLIAESRSTPLTEGKQSYSLLILAATRLIGAADMAFGSFANGAQYFWFFT